MNLEDALGGWPSGGSNQQGQSQGGGTWPGQPGQPSQPSWPGQPTQPTCPTQPSQPSWPGQPGQPSQPSWPGQPSQPSQPSWPGQPTQPHPCPPQPTWPGQPTQPHPCPPQPSKPSQPSWPGPPQPSTQNLVVPYHVKLPNGVYNKLLITIVGTIKPNAEMFTLDLCTGHGKELAFHLNPRFNDGGRKDTKAIVRNCCMDTKWGKEERELSCFPFVQGQQFEMKILCTNSEFRVAVNKNHLLEFKHRIRNLREIVNLHIYNDVTLSSVNMETLP